MKSYGKELNKIYTIIFLILIAISQIFQGLYYRSQYMSAFIFISFIFAFYIYSNFLDKEFIFISTYMDYALLGLILIYALNLFIGISKKDSFDGLLRAIAIFMIYKISYQLSKKDNEIMHLLFSFIGTITALASLMAAANIFYINGVFIYGKRLAGVYQYSNTLAVVLGAFLIYSTILYINLKNKYLKLFYIISQITIMTGFIASKSRGAAVIFLVVLIINLLLLKDKERIIYIGNSIIISIFSVISYAIFNKVTSPIYFILFYMFVIISSIIAFYVLNIINEFIIKYEIKKILFGFIALCIAAAITIIIGFNIRAPLKLNEKNSSQYYEIYNIEKNNKYILEVKVKALQTPLTLKIISINEINKSKNINTQNITVNTDKEISFKTLNDTRYITIGFVNYSKNGEAIIESAILKSAINGEVIKNIRLKSILLPADITEKITELNVKTATSSERGYFYKDGLKMWKDYPVVGAGVNAWDKLYTKYQSYNYKTKNVHNFYLQILIETGIIGFLVWLIIIFLIYRYIYKMYRTGNQENKAIALFGLFTMLLAHSFIDVNFMYTSIWFLVFAAIGMLTGSEGIHDNIKGKLGCNKYIKIGFSIITIMFIAVTIIISSGIKEADNAFQISSNNIDEAMYDYESAMSKDFFNADYILAYNELLEQKYYQTNNQAILDEMKRNFDKINKLDRYNIDYKQYVSDFYLKSSNYKDCMKELNDIVVLNPLNPISYEKKAAYNEIMLNLANKNKLYEISNLAKKNILAVNNDYKRALKNSLYDFKLTKKTLDIISKVKK